MFSRGGRRQELGAVTVRNHRELWESELEGATVSEVANSFYLACPLRWLGFGCLEYYVEKNPEDSSGLRERGLSMITSALHGEGRCNCGISASFAALLIFTDRVKGGVARGTGTVGSAGGPRFTSSDRHTTDQPDPFLCLFFQGQQICYAGPTLRVQVNMLLLIV